jgi:hypothetical protein
MVAFYPRISALLNLRLINDYYLKALRSEFDAVNVRIAAFALRRE